MGYIGSLRKLNWNAILTTSCCLMLGFVVVIMHKKIYDVMMNDPSYQLNMDQLQAASFPDWADGRVKRDVQEQLASGSSLSVYDTHFLRKLTSRYEASKWVRDVRSIERRGLDGIKVALELRRPVAVIADRSGHKYLVDRKGVRLPGTYDTIPERFGTVYRIKGQALRVPEPGNAWNSGRIRAAVSVAAHLQRSQLSKALRVRYLELDGTVEDWRNGNGQIIIRTSNDKSVVWGGTEELGNPWEPSPNRKLKNLRRVLRGAPDLRGLKTVKLQFSDPIVSMQ